MQLIVQKAFLQSDHLYSSHYSVATSRKETYVSPVHTIKIDEQNSTYYKKKE